MIVHFTESLAGIRAVHAFRREPRNQEIFDELDDRYYGALVFSNRLGAIFGTGILFLGRLTTVIVLLYGGERVLQGDMTVGVLAAFLLYLRRFFEPMQDLSQFYTQFQGAAAALEKLVGRARRGAGGPGGHGSCPASRTEGRAHVRRRALRVPRRRDHPGARARTCRPGRRSRSSARPAPARRRSPG